MNRVDEWSILRAFIFISLFVGFILVRLGSSSSSHVYYGTTLRTSEDGSRLGLDLRNPSACSDSFIEDNKESLVDVYGSSTERFMEEHEYLRSEDGISNLIKYESLAKEEYLTVRLKFNQDFKSRAAMYAFVDICIQMFDDKYYEASLDPEGSIEIKHIDDNLVFIFLGFKEHTLGNASIFFKNVLTGEAERMFDRVKKVCEKRYSDIWEQEDAEDVTQRDAITEEIRRLKYDDILNIRLVQCAVEMGAAAEDRLEVNNFCHKLTRDFKFEKPTTPRTMRSMERRVVYISRLSRY